VKEGGAEESCSLSGIAGRKGPIKIGQNQPETVGEEKRQTLKKRTTLAHHGTAHRGSPARGENLKGRLLWMQVEKMVI